MNSCLTNISFNTGATRTEYLTTNKTINKSQWITLTVVSVAKV